MDGSGLKYTELDRMDRSGPKGIEMDQIGPNLTDMDQMSIDSKT